MMNGCCFSRKHPHTATTLLLAFVTKFDLVLNNVFPSNALLCGSVVAMVTDLSCLNSAVITLSPTILVTDHLSDTIRRRRSLTALASTDDDDEEEVKKVCAAWCTVCVDVHERWIVGLKEQLAQVEQHLQDAKERSAHGMFFFEFYLTNRLLLSHVCVKVFSKSLNWWTFAGWTFAIAYGFYGQNFCHHFRRNSRYFDTILSEFWSICISTMKVKFSIFVHQYTNNA